VRANANRHRRPSISPVTQQKTSHEAHLHPVHSPGGNGLSLRQEQTATIRWLDTEARESRPKSTPQQSAGNYDPNRPEASSKVDAQGLDGGGP